MKSGNNPSKSTYKGTTRGQDSTKKLTMDSFFKLLLVVQFHKTESLYALRDCLSLIYSKELQTSIQSVFLNYLVGLIDRTNPVLVDNSFLI